MEKEKIGYRIFLFGESIQIIELVLDPGQKISVVEAAGSDKNRSFEK